MEKTSSPQFAFFRIWAASIMLSKLPPAQPAMMPCWTWSLPSMILSVRQKSWREPPPRDSASFSTLRRMSPRFALNSSMV